MEILHIDKKSITEESKKSKTRLESFEKLLAALRKKALPDHLIQQINSYIEPLNANQENNNKWFRKMRKIQDNILILVEKEVKIVPVNYYRNRWLALGMAVFGIPFGIALGISLRSMAFIAIGIPFGMAIGIAIGSDMDKKAKLEDRQLDVEIK